MTPLAPFVREAGSGPRRRLLRLGQSPSWASDSVITLRHEVDLVEPVLTEAGSPVTLVRHSYGAVLALIAALADPGRVMVVYEPTLFALVRMTRRRRPWARTR